MQRMYIFPVAAITLVAACDLFSDVVIPVQDNDAPIALATIYENGQHVDATQNRTTNDPNMTWTVVASAIDDGGAHRVKLHQWGKVYCDHGGYTSIRFVSLAPVTVVEYATVGDTVSNGLWTLNLAQPGTWSCPAGTSVIRAEYDWGVDAEDFHGNISHASAGLLTYEP